MKKLFLIALIAFGINAKAQFILAGVHGAQDYYYDIVPDTIIQLPTPTPMNNFKADTFLVDINNDNIVDFRFILGNCGYDCTPNFAFCKIEPLHNNLIATSGFDSCFDYSCLPPKYNYRKAMLDSLSLNDSINNNNAWVKSSLFLSRGEGSMDAYCAPQFYSCGSATFGTNSNYVGVAVSDTSGIYYGWIRVKIVSSGSLVIEEYACNSKMTTGIKNYNNNISLRNYPNPVTNSTRIDYTFPDGVDEGEIVFYDLMGKEIKHYKVDRTFDHLLLSTADLPTGTYYFQLQTSKQNSAGKKIVVIK